MTPSVMASTLLTPINWGESANAAPCPRQALRRERMPNQPRNSTPPQVSSARPMGLLASRLAPPNTPIPIRMRSQKQQSVAVNRWWLRWMPRLSTKAFWAPMGMIMARPRVKPCSVVASMDEASVWVTGRHYKGSGEIREIH
ncbi:hypothetical protein D3C78_1425540 [compost metagenome]